MSAALEISADQYAELLAEVRSVKTQVAAVTSALAKERQRASKAFETAEWAAHAAERATKQVAPPKLLTLRDAAARVGIDVKTLRKAIEAGRVGTVTIEKRRMIPLAELEALMHPTVAKGSTRRRPSSGPPRGYSVEAELAKLKELDRCRR